MKLEGHYRNVLLVMKLLVLVSLIGSYGPRSAYASINITACVRPLPLGTCRQVLRYAYNPQTRNCFSFYYTGCNNVQNSFLTFEECRRDCMENIKY